MTPLRSAPSLPGLSSARRLRSAVPRVRRPVDDQPLDRTDHRWICNLMHCRYLFMFIYFYLFIYLCSLNCARKTPFIGEHVINGSFDHRCPCMQMIRPWTSTVHWSMPSNAQDSDRRFAFILWRHNGRSPKVQHFNVYIRRSVMCLGK